MGDTYDIAIIGSGIGGLVSAALLSAQGSKVLILEKEPKAGGYLTEFTRGDFVFDVSLHLLNGCGPGQYGRDIFTRCGIIDDLRFLRPRYLYRSVFPDHDIRVPQAGIEAYKDTLMRSFPDSKSGIDGLFAEMSAVFDAARGHRTAGGISPVLLRHMVATFDSVMGRHIEDARLKAVIGQLWIYFGLPPSMLRAIDFSYPCVDYLSNGGYYLEKGSYEIVRALVRRIEARGGRFLFNRRVDRISARAGGGYRVSFGKEGASCDTVISNIDIAKTLNELLDRGTLPHATLKRFDGIVPSISAFELFLGIDADLARAYPDDYEIFVNSGYDLDDQYDLCVRNDARRAPFVITINSNVNRSSAPAGKSVVTVIMLAGHGFWRSGSRREYQDKKDRCAETLIERAGRIIPEIRTGLATKMASTPLTFERYTDNREGAIYGYSRVRGQRNELRPNEATGTDNLYFASAWARQGSGVAKVLHAADEVCKKIAARPVEKIAR